jgi:hypothetical protein
MFDKLTVAKLVTTFPSPPHPPLYIPSIIQVSFSGHSVSDIQLNTGSLFFTSNIVSYFPSQFRHARVRVAERTTVRRYRADRKWQPIVVR